MSENSYEPKMLRIAGTEFFRVPAGHKDRWEETLDPFEAETGEAFLPHSCDEWVIGGEEPVRQLITDLQAALDSGLLKKGEE